MNIENSISNQKFHNQNHNVHDYFRDQIWLQLVHKAPTNLWNTFIRGYKRKMKEEEKWAIDLKRNSSANVEKVDFNSRKSITLIWT